MSAPGRGNTTRLRAVVFDAAALVDRHGEPFGDVGPSLLAAREAGLRVVLLADAAGPSVERAMDGLRGDVDVITSSDPREGIQGAVRHAGVRRDATLHIAAREDAVRAAHGAGVRTAWLNRAGTAGDVPAELEWRDLLGLVALCGSTPALARSEPRC